MFNIQAVSYHLKLDNIQVFIGLREIVFEIRLEPIVAIFHLRLNLMEHRPINAYFMFICCNHTKKKLNSEKI